MPLALILSVCFPSLGAGQLTSIEGRVTDSTGAVLVGVRVVAVHELSGGSVTTHSGELGDDRFAALRVGIHSHSRSAGVHDAAQVRGRVTFRPGEATTRIAFEQFVAGLLSSGSPTSLSAPTFGSAPALC